MLSAVIVQHGAEETPPLVESVLIVAAFVPLVVFFILAIHVAFVEMGWDPLGALVRPIEERVTRRVFGQRPAHRNHRRESEARPSSTQFELGPSPDDGLGDARTTGELDGLSALQHTRRRSHLEEDLVAASHRRRGDTEAPPSDRAKRLQQLMAEGASGTCGSTHGPAVRCGPTRKVDVIEAMSRRRRGRV